MSSSAVLTSVRRLRRLLAVQNGQELSDEQLLTAFAVRHEDSAFAALVRRHGPMVLGVCRRVLGHEQDAEDAFQATFLVLAQQASSLRNKSALASFLYGTAYHLASKAKRAAGRRRKYEGRAPARSCVHPSEELLWREVRTLLDEEIAHLPEKYRSVFVLCCLEELSQAAAGRRLGLKEGTVANRLAEARKRLSRRLARRGVELTAVLTAATLATPPASALPPILIATTMKAALATATMMGSKAKIVTVLWLAVSLLTVATSGSLVFWYGRASGPPAVKADEKPRASFTKSETTKSVEIRGRVLDPDGKPKAGAKLLSLGSDKKIAELGVTAADGRFSVAVPEEAKDHYLVAQTDDTGFDVLWLGNPKTKEPVELRLVKDQPIRGRVVNTEGKPVAGVRVGITDINIYQPNSLDLFLAFWKNLRVGQNPLYGNYQLRDAAAVLFATTTDGEGKFVLRGLGDERFISLRLRGTGIADTELWIATRPGFDPKPFNKAVSDNTPKELLGVYGKGRSLHGPDVTVVAEAEKIIRGSVKDAKSGKGRPNIVVHLNQGYSDLQAQTDAEGRYEFRGASKAKSYALEVRSDPATGYMGCQVGAADTPGYQPVVADLSVNKGVLVTGKMIDQATGKPVSGYLRIAALNDNAFVKEYPGFESVGWNSVAVTDSNGVFRIIAIPGPVLLMGGPRVTGGDFKYKPSEVDPNYRQYFRVTANSVAFYRSNGGIAGIEGRHFKVLEIEPDTKAIEQNIVLERLPALTVQIQDGDGKPLPNAYITGLTARGHWPIWYDECSCTAYGIQPSKPRLMIFYHAKRKLAAAITLKGDEKQPVAVKLDKAGAIKGRLLDTDGNPLSGVRIDLRYHNLNADTMHRCIHQDKQIVTDADGTFANDDVIPGFTFELRFRRGRQRFEREPKPADATIQVKPGECHDLIAIKLKRLPE